MRWLFDEMSPEACTQRLSALGHDAISVREIGLRGCSDAEVLSVAIDQDRILVTENFGDFSVLLEQSLSRDDPCIPIVFVHRTHFPRPGAMPGKVASLLHTWAGNNPVPYVGPHWPK